MSRNHSFHILTLVATTLLMSGCMSTGKTSGTPNSTSSSSLVKAGVSASVNTNADQSIACSAPGASNPAAGQNAITCLKNIQGSWWTPAVQHFFGTDLPLNSVNIASDGVANCLVNAFPGARRSCDFFDGPINFGGGTIQGTTTDQDCPAGIKCNNICGLKSLNIPGVPAQERDCINAGRLAALLRQQLDYINESSAKNTEQLVAGTVCNSLLVPYTEYQACSCNVSYYSFGKAFAGCDGYIVGNGDQGNGSSCKLLLNGSQGASLLTYRVGEASTWQVTGAPAGSNYQWFGTRDGVVDMNGAFNNDPSSFNGPFQANGAGHTFTRYVVVTNAAGSQICNTLTSNGGQPLNVRITN